MSRFIVIILHAYLAMAPAEELAQNSVDELVDKVLNKLIDKMFAQPVASRAGLSRMPSMIAPRVAPTTSRAVTLFNDIPNLELSLSGNRQVRMEAMRGGSMFPPVPALSASPTMSRVNIPLTGMSVQAMQDTLKTYGIAPSPIQKLALTQLASTRDPSMKAQVRDVYSSLDPALQSKVKKASREVIARAGLRQDSTDLGAGEVGLDVKSMAGITEPLGFWDPMEITTDIEAGRLYFLRECELKNGRVAMLAILGIIVTGPLGFRPFASESEWVSGVASHFKDQAVNEKFWPALVIGAGIAEMFTYPGDRSKAPGDLGFDPLGMKPKEASKLMEISNKELNNGRLAMLAMAGIYGQELMVGQRLF